MKAIIFFMIVSGLVDAQAPATSSEKDRAIAISSELKAVAQGGDASDAQWNAIDDEIDDYQKTFGVNPKTTHNVVLLRQTELAVAMRSGNDTLVKKLAADPQPEVAALVARIADLKTKPLDLKFTALDGRAVDFASLRGKVVLLDFWATWCGPCVEEVPHVVAAYRKYHDQGFEIVGVSLDQDKDAVQAFTAANGMTWPQYFDGQGWKNAHRQARHGGHAKRPRRPRRPSGPPAGRSFDFPHSSSCGRERE
jgi:thiol-disulfide isomerase/thioredoxin